MLRVHDCSMALLHGSVVWRRGVEGIGGRAWPWLHIQKILSRILRSRALLRARSGVKPTRLDISETVRWLGFKPSYSLVNLLSELSAYGDTGPPQPTDA